MNNNISINKRHYGLMQSLIDNYNKTVNSFDHFGDLVEGSQSLIANLNDIDDEQRNMLWSALGGIRRGICG